MRLKPMPRADQRDSSIRLMPMPSADELDPPTLDMSSGDEKSEELANSDETEIDMFMDGIVENLIPIARAPTHMPYGNEPEHALHHRVPTRRLDTDDEMFLVTSSEAIRRVEQQEIKLRTTIRKLQITQFDTNSGDIASMRLLDAHITSLKEMCGDLMDVLPNFGILFDILRTWGEAPQFDTMGYRLKIWRNEDPGFKKMKKWKKGDNIPRNQFEKYDSDLTVARDLAVLSSDIITECYTWVTTVKEALVLILVKCGAGALRSNVFVKVDPKYNTLANIRKARKKNAIDRDTEKYKKNPLRWPDGILKLCYEIDLILEKINLGIVHQLRMRLIPPVHSTERAIPDIILHVNHLIRSKK